MSLIQAALEKAHQPEPEEPKPVPIISEEPRMQTNKFYEAVETEVNPVFAGKKRKTLSRKPMTHTAPLTIPPQYRMTAAIAGMIFFSILAGVFILPAKTTVQPMPMSSQSVVMKTQTPVTQKTISQVKFMLTGITEADGVQLALINDQVVGVGDLLREKAVVKSIAESAVTLEWQGRQITLTL